MNTASKGRDSLTSTKKGSFLITVDTEEDNAWISTPVSTIRNAAYLPRFQELCERYGMRPTYLTTYEMAHSDEFREFARSILSRRVGEVGMHLHAWRIPPEYSLTSDDIKFKPYLIEYPQAIIKEKVTLATRCLEDTFQQKMVSHRAGRWSFDSSYARVLVELGYRVDCSVTPHVSWQSNPGNPAGPGGTDYRACPEEPYFLDLSDISRAGDSTLLEVPVTIRKGWGGWFDRVRARLPRATLLRRAFDRVFPSVYWLMPARNNLRWMLKIVERAELEKREHLELAMHSSELMPGSSPTFPTTESIERLYENLQCLFERISRSYHGSTLAEFRDRFEGRPGPGAR